MIGQITKESQLSMYQPSAEVVEFTKYVQQDYSAGQDILDRTWVELNDRSITEDENRGKGMFNAFVDTSVEDPNEAWKWRGTRSMARNKGIAMHANLTANYIIPTFTAQNDDDEVDRDFSEIMRDIVQWMTLPANSNYQSSFLQVVFGMITNPVTYLSAEYCEVFQTIREKQEDGKYLTKEILDDVFSGFHAPILSSSQVLITNAFERNIQKQRRIIKRRHAEKQELEAKFGSHENWMYVKPGWKTVYNDEDGLFYDIKDDDRPYLVAEETVLSRRDDSEVSFIGGIYMGDANVYDNPIKHRDHRNAPKYNVVPFGYSRIGEHFFYYKSMMNCLGWDNMLYDAMSEIVMNRSMLEVDIPVAVSGSDEINSSVMFPSAVVTFENPDAKISPLIPNSNMAAGFNALRETEKSMTEGSVNPTVSGQLPEASQTAYSVSQAQASAKKLIGGVGKSLTESMTMYGDLMKDIVINHVTVPQVDELVGGGMRLKYRTFLLQNKSGGGKMMDRTIKFDESLIGQSYTKQEMEDKHLKLLEDSGYPDSKNSIRIANPELFARFRYLANADVEEMFSRNSEYWQPILTSLYQFLKDDPNVDGTFLLNKLSYAYFGGEGDRLIRKEPLLPPGGEAVGGGQANQFGSMVNAKKLSTAANNAV